MERLRRKEIDLGLYPSLTQSPQQSVNMRQLQCSDSTYLQFLGALPCRASGAARVWDYTIGGYQVIKKWLSYREHKLLGRPLTTDEAREVINIAFFSFRGHSSLALRGASR